MKTSVQKLLLSVGLLLLATLPWSCLDHRLPPTLCTDETLTQCSTGWRVVQNNVCERNFFQTDGTFRREDCSGTTAVITFQGRWTRTDCQIRIEGAFTSGASGIILPYEIRAATSTTLTLFFLARGGTEQTYTCN